MDRYTVSIIVLVVVLGGGGIARSIRMGKSADRLLEKYAGDLYRDEDGKLRHGPYERRYDDGTVRERGAHVKGRRDGIWTFWNADGEIQWQAFYKNGERLETKEDPPWMGDEEDQ